MRRKDQLGLGPLPGTRYCDPGIETLGPATLHARLARNWRDLPSVLQVGAEHLRHPLQQLPANHAVRDDERTEVPVINPVTDHLGDGGDRFRTRAPVDQSDFTEMVVSSQGRFLPAANADPSLAGLDHKEDGAA